MPEITTWRRPDPTAPLMPEAAWRDPFDHFLGYSIEAPVFEIDGRTDEFEHYWEIEKGDVPFWRSAEGYEIHMVEDWEPETLLLFSPNGEACGFYTGGMIWIDPEHRGRGLGAEMVLAMTEAIGASPTRHHNGLGFSPAGMSVHEEAWRRAVERAHEAGLAVPPDLVALVASERDQDGFGSEADSPGPRG